MQPAYESCKKVIICAYFREHTSFFGCCQADIIISVFPAPVNDKTLENRRFRRYFVVFPTQKHGAKQNTAVLHRAILYIPSSLPLRSRRFSFSYFRFVASPPRIWRSFLFFSVIAFTSAYSPACKCGSLTVISLCTVDLEIPNAFAVLRTVAECATIYSPSRIALASKAA